MVARLSLQSTTCLRLDAADAERDQRYGDEDETKVDAPSLGRAKACVHLAGRQRGEHLQLAGLLLGNHL